MGAVGMAAVGSHVLTGKLDAQGLHWVDVAVQMQGWHALALVLCGAWAVRGGPAAHVAGALFLLGTVLFCIVEFAETLLLPWHPSHRARHGNSRG